MRSRRPRYINPHDFNIPEKANRVLNLILFMLVLIVLRIWHLSVIQYDVKAEESRRPQRRVVVEPARRATIRDRFNEPLAINEMQYRAAILYSQLRTIPAVAWATDENGKRFKQYKRKEYITALSHLLAEHLQMDAERLEDLVYSKAALYYNLPFVIKEDISEQEYYRLKMLEKDWPGIYVQHLPKRTYPKGRIAADVIGYMGAINRQEYEGIIHEIKALEEYLHERDEGDDPSLPAGVSSPVQARLRLKQLRELAYTVNDYVGKGGIEGRFEEELRGFQGKKSYYSDARGNFLRELPGSKEPMPGKRFLLTISSELQEYAERLLIQNEKVREVHVSHVDLADQARLTKEPWLKGGAIVAMDPYTGEVLALASHPRLDPNDFIASGNATLNAAKQANIVRWFETEEYIRQVWDQKRPLERELFDVHKGVNYEDAVTLTWERYLDFILPRQGVISSGIKRVSNVENAIELQQTVTTLLEMSGQSNLYWLLNVLYSGGGHTPCGKRMSASDRAAIEDSLEFYEGQVPQLKKTLNYYVEDIPQHYDKVLLIDLCRLVVRDDLFSDALINAVGDQRLAAYRDTSAAMANVEPAARSLCKAIYRQEHFKVWRTTNEQEFLKGKRAEEKKLHRYPKPYIDYLDEIENQMFAEFWQMHRWQLLMAFLKGETIDDELQPYAAHLVTWHRELAEGAHQAISWRTAYTNLQKTIAALPTALVIPYLQTLRSFQDLTRPLYGNYRHLRKLESKQLEKHLAAAFYPIYGFGYGRSYAYRQAATQGSVFKLVTAYSALIQRYKELEPTGHITRYNLNPLDIVDNTQKHGTETTVGFHANGKPIPILYKGGRLPKSLSNKIGRINLVQALETSSNPYFALLAGDFLHSPESLLDAARLFSFGSRTGIDLPGEIPGRLPKDLAENRTGLYATSIGQHTLVVTPLQTAVMLSTIANGGRVLKPKIVLTTVATQKDSSTGKILCPPSFPYQESLALAGIDFPLFAAAAAKGSNNLVRTVPTEVRREVFMPAIVRNMLLEGMHSVVARMQQNGLHSLSRLYHEYPGAISDYVDLKNDLVGKTSSAEALETIDLDSVFGTNTYTHVWFGGISFDSHADGQQAFIARDAQGYPEIVVVVYLRFGKYGKEAAPLAAQVVKKWREIKGSKKYD